MKIDFYWRWHARQAGGLFLGLLLGFPVNLLYPNKEVWTIWHVGIGLLVTTVCVDFRFRQRTGFKT
jgi:hypothetical protein